jgi:putative hydrolase of the HAD superfamily
MFADTAIENEPRRCSVFLTPAPEDFAFLAGMIRELSPKFDAPPFEPHVTVYSGMFPDPAAVQRALAAAVAGTPPLTLRVRGIGCTEEYFKTLFIEFEEDALLRSLHDRIKAECGVGSCYELIPHLSLLYADLPLRDKEALARRVALDRTEIRFDEVKLVTPLNLQEGWRDPMLWKTLARVKLGGKEAHPALRAVLFDYGGVLATEGFREGLHAIARRQGLDPLEVHRLAMEAIYDSGYIVGRGSEADFWSQMRARAGIRGMDAELAGEILPRFIIRPRMIEMVRRLRRKGIIVAILSDQTDWLERLEARDRFFGEFDQVFNSYRMGKGKRDPTVFADAAAALGVSPREALFIDDMPANVQRAREQGMQGFVFEDEERFLAELERLLD